MTPHALDLARRLAVHPRFQWRPGMNSDGYGRVAYPYGNGRASDPGNGAMVFRFMGPDLATHGLYAGAVPDLDDWATVGCLLGMLDGLRLVQAPTILTPVRVGWTIQWRRQGGGTYQTSDATLGEAVAAALLAAWGEP